MGHELIALHHVQMAMPPGEGRVARGFYGELLGMTEIAKPEELAGRGGLWFRIGDLEVHLGVEREGFTPARKAHPAFVARGLNELRAKLDAAGYAVDEDAEFEGYRCFHVHDPLGNRLEIMERT